MFQNSKLFRRTVKFLKPLPVLSCFLSKYVSGKISLMSFKDFVSTRKNTNPEKRHKSWGIKLLSKEYAVNCTILVECLTWLWLPLTPHSRTLTYNDLNILLNFLGIDKKVEKEMFDPEKVKNYCRKGRKKANQENERKISK